MDKKQKKDQRNQAQVSGMENFAESAARASSDVLGSYTGVPLIDEDDMPVQDADDL